MKAQFTTEQINAALAPFGASLTPEGFITRDDKLHGIKIIAKGRRLRYETATGTLMASGRQDAASIAQFVKAFWYWTPRS